jgi:branched-chain amino acid transport system ATP-binding protein
MMMRRPVQLDVKHLQAGYDTLQVLWDISLHVDEGEFVGLVGLNGAGKSTTLKSIVGLIPATSGEVSFLGNRITGIAAHSAIELGISLVPETLNLFPRMTVFENLLLGAHTVRDTTKLESSLDQVFELFPRLQERRKQLAGTLSGGERKMLAIARGLMAAPKILLVDEPSLGLAPKLVRSVLTTLVELNRSGMSILLVEQNVHSVLRITDRCYVLEQGRIVLEGESSELIADEHVRQAYLGT